MTERSYTVTCPHCTRGRVRRLNKLTRHMEWKACPACKGTGQRIVTYTPKKVRCPVCGHEFLEHEQYAYLSGDYYCSQKCYDTLFEECQECHQVRMDARSNRIHHNEQLCDPCRDKKHGWIVVTYLDPNAGHYHRR